MSDSTYESAAPNPTGTDVITPAARLPFRDHFGRPFSQPLLTNKGLETEEYCYVRDDGGADAEDTYRVSRSNYQFDTSNSVSLLSTEERGVRRRLPATVSNLMSFLALPFISEDQQAKASKMLYRWAVQIPTACFTSLIYKATSVPDELAPPYRVLARKYPVTESVTRDLTPLEVMYGRMGRPVPTIEERTVSDTVWHDEPLPETAYINSFSPRRMYSQQINGVITILDAKRIGLFFDMRVGKTMTAIVAGKIAIMDLGTADFFVVVSPKGNMYDPWEPELQLAGFDTAVIDGTRAEDEYIFNLIGDGNDLPYHRRPGNNGRPLAVIVNYERVGLRWDEFAQLNLERMFVALDETSAIKNPAASRSKAAHDLCHQAAYVVLLNGTPMEQGPHDLFSQLKCLDTHGTVIGLHFGDFVKKFLQEVAPGKYRVSGSLELRRAFELMLASLSIRYLRSEADQFAGKDKTFRYIAIKPTKAMINQAKNVEAGFIKTITEAGEHKDQEVSTCVLAVYSYLRELSCGYDKYREDDDPKFYRVRHAIDPKLLWLRAFLEANTSESCVLYVNFNEQEQACKELLNELGHSWAATKPACRVIWKRKLRESLPYGVVDWLTTKFNVGDTPNRITGFNSRPDGHFTTPPWLIYDEGIITAVEQRFYGYIDKEKVYVEGSYTAQERAEQTRRFNHGEVQHFILKVKQGRGITLNRSEAVAEGIGAYPSIVFLSPPWSLGDWDQAQDRCVGIDPVTKKNINTPIYALAVPGIERKIIQALRAKKEVQAELLGDAKVVGYQSFVSSLIEDMANADHEGLFDADEMWHKIRCGVSPTSKLTKSIILNKMIEKHGRERGWRNKKDVLSWLQAVPRTAVTFDKDGAILDMSTAIRDSFYALYERTPEYKQGVAS